MINKVRFPLLETEENVQLEGGNTILTAKEKQELKETINNLKDESSSSIDFNGKRIHLRVLFWSVSFKIQSDTEEIEYFINLNTVFDLNLSEPKRVLLESIVEYFETGDVKERDGMAVEKSRLLVIGSEEALQLTAGRPYYFDYSKSLSNRQLSVYIDGEVKRFIVRNIDGYSEEPNLYLNGKIVGKKKEKLFIRGVYGPGFNKQDLTNVFFWDDENKFRIVVDKVIMFERGIYVQDEDGAYQGKDVIRTMKNRFSMSINKDTGAVYIKSGKQLRWATYNSYNTLELRMNNFLEVLPDFLLERIHAHFHRQLTPWRQDLYREMSLTSIIRMAYENYFKAYQYINVQPSNWGLDYAAYCGMDLSSYSIKKLKTVTSQVEFARYLYPTLSKKQMKKVTFLAGKESMSEDESDAWIINLITDVNIIRKYLESSNYCLPVKDFGGRTRMAKIRDSFLNIMSRERLERILGRYIESHNYNEDWLLRDSLKAMLELIETDSSVEPFEGNTVRELHNHLVKHIKIKEDAEYTKPIAYTEEEKAMEYRTDNFKLELAKTKMELTEVGSEMKICVGQLYAESAFKKQLNIAVVREVQTDKPLLCIELVGDKIRQAKKACNQYVASTEPVGQFFKTWQEENKLKLLTGDYVEQHTELNF